MAGLIACKDVSLCEAFSGLWPPSSPFYKLREIERFVLPHASLRQALATPMATNGKGSVKVWGPCTPAMAAGLTDHVWSLKEVLCYRVPPWPQAQAR